MSNPALEAWYEQELEGAEERRLAFINWRQKQRYSRIASTQEIIWIASGGRAGTEPPPDEDF